MKLTRTTLVCSSGGRSDEASLLIKALCRNLKTSQFVLAPRTLVKRTRDASGGSERYGSRRGGILEDILKCLFGEGT